MTRVAILGCGPAGMLACHAAKLLGHSVTIFSNYQKSPMLGAQYMHRSIPDLSLGMPTKLAYILRGSIEGYREKVYGDIEAKITVSPELFEGFHDAWSIRQAYNLLWHKYNKLIHDTHIDSRLLQQVVGSYDAVISTIPAKALCYQREVHQFKFVVVWIDSFWHGHDFEEIGPSNVVVCNGFPYNSDNPESTGWYRTSNIFGHCNTEWSPIIGVMPYTSVPVRKPIETDCNCWPGIIRAGRYGAWKKGMLSHEAFELALEVLS